MPEPRTIRPEAGWFRLALRLIVLTSFAAIVFATLCPIGLRPRLGPANLERFTAFLIFGLALAAMRPGRSGSTLALVILIACGLEAAQLLAPGRDAMVHDAAVKALGGSTGVLSAAAFRRLTG